MTSFNVSSFRRKMKWLQIELYGECGDVEGAESVFNAMASSSSSELDAIDVSASNRMMNLYAERGDTDSALLWRSPFAVDAASWILELRRR